MCNAEECEILQCVHVLNDRNAVVGQQQHLKLSQIIQTLDFFDVVGGQI